MNKIGFISLGCPKNQVDSEMMLAKLASAGFEVKSELDDVDIVVINTCAFIEDAKKEAIENILDMVSMKEDGLIKKIVVTGCLSERYKQQVLAEIPEVDAVVGLGGNGDIVEVLNRLSGEDEPIEQFPPVCNMPIEGKRLLSTPEHWAYLKIADGCSNCCTYCAIPSIRGPFRSRKIENIITEAQQLAVKGVKELIVIAQDTTRYGEDIYGERKLPELLRELNEIDGLEWIRILYCYPERISDELLETMSKCEKVLNYIDLPVQHADGGILRAMNRTGDEQSLLKLLEKIRSYMPDCVIRTTLITGFPGEGEKEFETLSRFVNEARFDRLGCFSYSAEEGTAAADLPEQVEDSVKVERGEIIMQQQSRIFAEKQEALVGSVLRVVIDGYDAYTDSYCGRSWRDAPEIDSQVFVTCGYELNEGDFVNVEITRTLDCDLIGEVL